MRYLADLGLKAIDGRLGGVAAGHRGRESISAGVRWLRRSGPKRGQEPVQPEPHLLEAEAHLGLGQATMRPPAARPCTSSARNSTSRSPLWTAAFSRAGMLTIVPRTSVPTVTSAPG